MHPPVRSKLELVHAAIENCSAATVGAGFFLGIVALVAATVPCCVMCCCAKSPQV
jgi:hypothetical protein